MLRITPFTCGLCSTLHNFVNNMKYVIVPYSMYTMEWYTYSVMYTCFVVVSGFSLAPSIKLLLMDFLAVLIIDREPSPSAALLWELLLPFSSSA